MTLVTPRQVRLTLGVAPISLISAAGPLEPPIMAKSRPPSPTCAARSTASMRHASPADGARRHHRHADRHQEDAESGSAFRPAREADMMRRLVERHRGILPLDTAESIWRVIISTFTYVQAPFAVHADLSAGEAAMRDSARFHFGFTVPFVTHIGAGGVVAAVAASRGDIGLVPAAGGSTAHGGPRSKATTRRRSSHGFPSWSAPTIRRACRCSASRGRTRTRSLTDVETWSVRRFRLGPRGRARARSINGSDRSAGPRLRRRGAARLGAAGADRRARRRAG